ncbi:CHASE2 domain-containing protein [Paraburkholderia kururiensis]|uniref:CHASE2 domain-containing protein n=1 Tax=Paraburkholderia kururiensis TaxID=984307 RepID=UPI000A40B5CB|nr:CHASE2 domain-containing protein [Paraburkholderia kururiensis]
MYADDAPMPAGMAREWLALGVLLVLLSLTLTASGVLRRADLLFFDFAQPLLQEPSPTRIVLAAIDDASVKALGGWPVKRKDYAALIDRLTAAGAAAVGLDVAMPNRGRLLPSGDEPLAQAMARNGRVVLPLVVADGSEAAGFATSIASSVASSVATPVATPAIRAVIQPAAPMAGAAFAIAQANAAPDSDGVARSFYLLEGEPPAVYEHMSVSLLRASGVALTPCGKRLGREAQRWSGACRRYVPLGPEPSYASFSFVDLLAGRVAPSALKGAVVLIGPTTSTADTHLVTPGRTRRPLSGVEFLAEATHALASGSLVRDAPWVGQFLFSLCVLPLLCAAQFALGPRAGLLAALALALAACLASLVLLKTTHVFFFPSAAVAACLVAWPASAWRRQEALLRYLGEAAASAMAEPGLPGEPTIRTRAVDPLHRRVLAMSAVIARLRRSARFISEWMNSLPEATLVVASSGVVMLANRKALGLYPSDADLAHSPPRPAGRLATDVLRDMTASEHAVEYVREALRRLAESHGAGVAGQGQAKADARTERAAPAPMNSVEIVDGKRRSLLIKCAVLPAPHASNAALIFHVADVTSMRTAERQRDSALRFLSHDIRSPQTAVLALIEQRRRAPADLPEPRFTELVAHYAQAALTLADQFLFLARAEGRPPAASTVDLALLLGDAVDDLWPQASAKHTAVRLTAEPGMLVVADAPLLRRAFANLIDNAIKFGPPGATVRVAAGEREGRWAVTIADTGRGIPADQIPNLFTEFFRLPSDRPAPGHGLGLAFVKHVVDTLGGQIHVESDVGHGSVFTLVLPQKSGSPE